MRRLIIAALCGVFCSCASVVTTTQHPTIDHPLIGCYIGCPAGYSIFGSFRQELLNCRNGSRWLEDLRITGEDDNPNDPSESRWFTGYLNTAAEGLILRRLADRGVTRLSKEWAAEYGAEEKRLRAEFGDSVRAAYLKIHVALESCDAFKRAHCLAIGTCAAHEGEPDPLHPNQQH